MGASHSIPHPRNPDKPEEAQPRGYPLIPSAVGMLSQHPPIPMHMHGSSPGPPHPYYSLGYSVNSLPPPPLTIHPKQPRDPVPPSRLSAAWSHHGSSATSTSSHRYHPYPTSMYSTHPPPSSYTHSYLPHMPHNNSRAH